MAPSRLALAMQPSRNSYAQSLHQGLWHVKRLEVWMLSSVYGVQEWTKFCQEKFGTGAAGFME